MTYDIHLQFIKEQLGRFKRRPNKPQPRPLSTYQQLDNYWEYVEWAAIHTGTHIPTRRQGGDIE